VEKVIKQTMEKKTEKKTENKEEFDVKKLNKPKPKRKVQNVNKKAKTKSARPRPAVQREVARPEPTRDEGKRSKWTFFDDWW